MHLPSSSHHFHRGPLLRDLGSEEPLDYVYMAQ